MINGFEPISYYHLYLNENQHKRRVKFFYRSQEGWVTLVLNVKKNADHVNFTKMLAGEINTLQ